MTFKRIICLLLAVTTIFCFAACGEKEDDKESEREREKEIAEAALADYISLSRAMAEVKRKLDMGELSSGVATEVPSSYYTNAESESDNGELCVLVDASNNVSAYFGEAKYDADYYLDAYKDNATTGMKRKLKASASSDAANLRAKIAELSVEYLADPSSVSTDANGKVLLDFSSIKCVIDSNLKMEAYRNGDEIIVTFGGLDRYFFSQLLDAL